MCSGCPACLRSAFGGAVNANVADTHTDAPVHSCCDLQRHTIHLDGGDSLGTIVSDRDRCVGLETYLHVGQVEASLEASSSSSDEQATRKQRKGATKEVDDLGVRAPQYQT